MIMLLTLFLDTISCGAGNLLHFLRLFCKLPAPQRRSIINFFASDIKIKLDANPYHAKWNNYFFMASIFYFLNQFIDFKCLTIINT